MTSFVTIVLATHNRGKLRELKNLLTDWPVKLLSLDDFGPIPEVVEDGTTFEANAYKKASQTARVLGHVALADDSGLCVEALDGRPGVYSARYGGEGLTDRQRGELLLKEMVGQKNRKAAFECVISIAVPEGPALTYEGRCEGMIADKMMGENGFGYDPLFLTPETGQTFAQMSAENKARYSHRGRALQEVKTEFDNIIKWIEIHMPPMEANQCLGVGHD